MLSASGLDRYERQVRAFGAQGQRALRNLKIAVVGVGGVGSLVVQGLAHVGAGHLMLVDPDRIDATNLNRVVGARESDVRRHRRKVSIASRLVRSIDPSIACATFASTVLAKDLWTQLRCADVLIGAVDDDAARWALNLLAVAHTRLYLDIGVEITEGASGTLEVAGHVAAVRPGGPCLRCLQGYDPVAASAALQPRLQDLKRSSGYLREKPEEVAPSVIFLNQAVAALSLSELLNWVAPWKPPAAYLLVDLGQPCLRTMEATIDPACPICGPGGVRSLGDAAGVPAFPRPQRRSATHG